MYGLEEAATELTAALARLRAVIGDTIDPIATNVAAALSRMRFEVRLETDGPFHRAEFSSVPKTPEGPMFASFAEARGIAPPLLVAVIDALEALQRALVLAADSQEYVDANLNSAQYLRAAGYLDLVEPHVVALARHLAPQRIS